MPDLITEALLGDDERRPMSVSEITALIRGDLESTFTSVWIEGEVLSFTRAASGHWYFSLKDSKAQIRAACFVQDQRNISVTPFNGLQAIVRGRLGVYPQRGDYQIIVHSVEDAGKGALTAEFERIKRKLEAEGLFSPSLKREIPFLPRRVGIVTSSSGAAFHDIVRVLTRRTRTVDIMLLPVRVQGAGASEDMCAAIEMANRYNTGVDDLAKIDVLIVGRGGGSQEDLFAFNDETLARTIRASEIPVISAVGHEIDTTIADLVADLRAPTPSAAAEIVAASEDAIRDSLKSYFGRMRSSIDLKVSRLDGRLRSSVFSKTLTSEPTTVTDARYRFDYATDRLNEGFKERVALLTTRFDRISRRLSPQWLAKGVAERRGRFDLLQKSLAHQAAGLVAKRRESLSVLVAELDAMSPLAVLSRGYSITKSGDSVVTSVSDVTPGDRITISVSDGTVEATVNQVRGGENCD